MMAKNQLIGLVLLGFDRSSSMIRKSDAALLLQLAEQASLAFQNAALYREQQERLVRLHRADRLAAMGQLAAGVAHEVRNPLTAIRSTMQYLGTTVEGSHRELFEDLIGEVDRIDHIISGLLNLARTGNLQRLPVDLADLTEQTVRFLDHRARKQNAKISAQSSEPIMVEADPNQLRQVFLNLILNALQAMPEGGSIIVDCQIEPDRSRPSQSWAQIRIIDDGPGIPEEVLRNVLDPFFTTKSEGTGLGLPICHNIIEQHG
ncbi:Sporulation kinase A, partial [Exaiptasia diaphana]